ncbi:hypothetical protein SAMN03080594_10523 [Arenibacter palladensis]|uniref:AhpC/TSA family protein n=1 Tax=Arenibacter palladensis TaxID=237373 RepID=A0A1M5CF78_9FLAO|nr:hypothetical protein [Arenibacter palladensis]SHF53403.1 hypothetical protein SAMN03080594_10523 [Arenibacter palladensis]|tara:strand:- start:2424 stop:3056 length:633 start_codon:yes stop_codon:yes gene_type:complete
MKKTLVLVTLFILPIVIYLFFASGITNFGRLATLTENVSEIDFATNDVSLEGKITVLGFLGKDVDNKKGNAFNLNQKIYKRFNEFNDFQFVMVMPKGTEQDVEELKKELEQLADIGKWNFVYGDEDDINRIFRSLKTNLSLDGNLSTPYVFIVDKNRVLRGRDDDEDEGVKYGFDTSSVADLNNKMEDDIKIILAEYRMALKKNNADRPK